MTPSPTSDQTTSTPTMEAQGLALAQMLAARLCHDMAGVVGTLSGTLELAEEDAESLAMARETAAALQARLKLLRAAFGAADQAMSFAELHNLLEALPMARRVHLHLEMMTSSRIWPAAAARLLLCVAMLGVESLAGEGELVMQEIEGGAVLVAASGPRATWPAGFAGQLTSPAIALEQATDQGPRGILGPLVALLAPAAGARLQLLIGAHAETAPPLLLNFI